MSKKNGRNALGSEMREQEGRLVQIGTAFNDNKGKKGIQCCEWNENKDTERDKRNGIVVKGLQGKCTGNTAWNGSALSYRTL